MVLEALEEKERKLLLDGYEYFHNHLADDTVFDEDYLKELHKKTFSSLYDFAGKYRDTNISKGETVFCQAKFLDQCSKDIFDHIKADNYLKDYSDSPKEELARKISIYMCDLIALHPFYEVNGRIIRLFFDMIATYNGYEYIDYKDTLLTDDEDENNKFITASIDCMTKNSCKMYNIIFNGLTKTDTTL